MLLAAGVAAGVALSTVVIVSLPASYGAEAHVLLEASSPDTAFDGQPGTIANDVIKELHLDTDPEFNPALRPVAWWKSSLLVPLRTWLQAQGIAIPTVQSDMPPAWPENRILDQLWSHVEISVLGQSSRILSIHATSQDARQAAAIANGFAQHHPGGGVPISLAYPSVEPESPPKDLIVLLGILGGLILGAFVARSAGGLTGTFRRADEVESRTNLPVIAIIPQLKDGKAALAQVLRDPLSFYCDSLRKLYIALHAADWTNPPRIVAISSAVSGEGRSILTASFGRLLAGEGKRVLLVDCDWRHPDLHRLFHLSNEIGLSSLVMGEHIALDDAIHTDALSGLDIITAGPQNRLPIPMLASERMQRTLADFAKNYELVLLDLPPVLMAGEALLLARMVDKLVFAIRWRHTRCKMSLNAIERIKKARGVVAGIVFTGVDPIRYQKDQQAHRPGDGYRGAPRMSRRPL